jgi:exodeoxyribonuclease X
MNAGDLAMMTVIDIETTGLNPEVDRVVEVAMAGIVNESGALSVGELWRSFVNPHRPIPPEASAVHGIVDDDVADAPDLDAVASAMGFDDFDIIAAHNCRFDRGFLPMLHEKRWIDTYRCAMHLWPDAPNFANQTLRYWLKLDLPRGRAHEAANDVTVTAHILIRQLGERSADELLRLSTKACVLRKVGFGKHFGSSWAEVPSDYLDWALKQDFDPDVRFTVRTELARRMSAYLTPSERRAALDEVEAASS